MLLFELECALLFHKYIALELNLSITYSGLKVIPAILHVNPTDHLDFGALEPFVPKFDIKNIFCFKEATFEQRSAEVMKL